VGLNAEHDHPDDANPWPAIQPVSPEEHHADDDLEYERHSDVPEAQT
jgi:hypothetical protein